MSRADFRFLGDGDFLEVSCRDFHEALVVTTYSLDEETMRVADEGLVCGRGLSKTQEHDLVSSLRCAKTYGRRVVPTYFENTSSTGETDPQRAIPLLGDIFFDARSRIVAYPIKWGTKRYTVSDFPDLAPRNAIKFGLLTASVRGHVYISPS
jgi:hypothetical protein